MISPPTLTDKNKPPTIIFCDLTQNLNCDTEINENCTQTSNISFSSVMVENSSSTNLDINLTKSNLDETIAGSNVDHVIKEGSTQTSKTILQLVLESGDIQSDKLIQQQNFLSSSSSSSSPPPLTSMTNDEGNQKSLTEQFLEKIRNRNVNSNKSFMDKLKQSTFPPAEPLLSNMTENCNALPKGITEISVLPKNISCCTQTNNYEIKSNGMNSNQHYLLPTTTSSTKNKLNDMKQLKELIPQIRRGHSTSPKMLLKNIEDDDIRKIPYIDQIKSNVSSSTTIIRKNSVAAYDNSYEPPNFNGNMDTIIEKINKGSTIDNLIASALSKLHSREWNLSLKGLAEIVEISRRVDIEIIYPHMTTINQRLIEMLKSPRSFVSRTACKAAGNLFEFVKDTRRPEFDDIIDTLLYKTADANKFIREDANLALDCMVTHVSTFHAIRSLCSKGPTHKNPLVRSAVVRLLICAVVIAGPEVILNPNKSDSTRKRIYLHMAKFLEDKNLETRKYAERLYKVLYKESRFETYLKKYFDKDYINRIKKTLKLVHKK